jgi:purine-binding chemotaxis protein CheW
VEILVFELTGQRYGIPLRGVREVVRAVAITPLPSAPAVIEGVINVRGALAPVFDLRARFGLPAKPLEPNDHLIIARARSRLIALRVDRAHWMLDVDDELVEDAARVVPQMQHIDGVAKLADGLVLIHDLDTFLSRAEEVALNRALAPPPGGRADGQAGGRAVGKLADWQAGETGGGAQSASGGVDNQSSREPNTMEASPQRAARVSEE